MCITVTFKGQMWEGSGCFFTQKELLKNPFAASLNNDLAINYNTNDIIIKQESECNLNLFSIPKLHYW